MAARTDRYTIVAITLHWLIAICILNMIPMGLWMTDAINVPETKSSAYQAFQLHKSIGLTILVLSILRLIWRLTHKPPPLNPLMPAWEKFAANATHTLFYVIMIGLPLTGWLYVSTGWSFAYNMALNVPTVWFGQFTVPHIPGFAEAPKETKEAAAVGFLKTHELLAYFTLALAALHIAAALKHHFVSRDDTLAHMLPFLRRKANQNITQS